MPEKILGCGRRSRSTLQQKKLAFDAQHLGNHPPFFSDDGKPLGPFTRESRIAEPRGLAVNRKDGLLFINSATDRVLAIDRNGVVVHDSGPIDGARQTRR